MNKFHFSAVILIIAVFYCSLVAVTDDADPIEPPESTSPFALPDTLDSSTSNDSLINEYPRSGEMTLRQQVLAYVARERQSRRERILPFLFQSENFHWKGRSDIPLNFSLEGFTLHPFLISDIHLLQNYQSNYRTTYRQGTIKFRNEAYRLSPSLTESFLGLGDENMNHAQAMFRKGNLLGIHRLHLQAGYLGMEGNWFGINEKSRNLQIKLTQEWKDFNFSGRLGIIDQEISSLVLAELALSEPTVLQEEIRDIALLIGNPWLDIGYRYELSKIAGQERIWHDLLVKRHLSWHQHQLEARLEHVWLHLEQDSTQVLLNLEQQSDWGPVRWQNSLRYLQSNDYQGNADIWLKLFSSLELRGTWRQLRTAMPDQHFRDDRFGAGIQFRENSTYFSLVAGKRDYQNDRLSWAEAEVLFSWKTGRWGWQGKGWASLLWKRDNPDLPGWQGWQQLICSYHLPHDNELKLGLNLVFLGDLRDPSGEWLEAEYQIDCFAAVQITRQFEIKTEFINLNNSSGLMDCDRLFHSPFHVNFRVNWIFLN